MIGFRATPDGRRVSGHDADMKATTFPLAFLIDAIFGIAALHVASLINTARPLLSSGQQACQRSYLLSPPASPYSREFHESWFSHNSREVAAGAISRQQATNGSSTEAVDRATKRRLARRSDAAYISDARIRHTLPLSSPSRRSHHFRRLLPPARDTRHLHHTALPARRYATLYAKCTRRYLSTDFIVQNILVSH